MAATPDLIFDLGVCNGDDSAYYLSKGHRVVGVEANPLLIPVLEQRFAREIAEGRYQLVPVGIAEADGEATFWVCDDHAEWSSFDRSIASRNGCRHHGVTITTCRFRTLLERFGTPIYCKIDLEGNDDLCLRDMTPESKPQFLSIEVIRGDRQLELLRRLGYRRFKLISQRTLRQPSKALALAKVAFARFASPSIVFTAIESRLSRRRFDGPWRFRGGTSGPFGDRTHGPWLDADEATELAVLLERQRHPSDWFDIHAAV